MCHPGNPDIVHFKGSRLGQASPPPRSLRHRTADTGVGRSLGGRLGRHGLASSIPGATDSMPQCDDHGCPHMFPNVPWGQNHLWSGSRYGGGRINACLSGGARRQSPPARCHSSEGPSRWSRAGDSTVSRLLPSVSLPKLQRPKVAASGEGERLNEVARAGPRPDGPGVLLRERERPPRPLAGGRPQGAARRSPSARHQEERPHQTPNRRAPRAWTPGLQNRRKSTSVVQKCLGRWRLATRPRSALPGQPRPDKGHFHVDQDSLH